MPNNSQEICRYYANGVCNKGASCRFPHPQQRNDSICRFYQAGKCSYGNTCRYLHVKSRNDTNPSNIQSTSTSTSNPVARRNRVPVLPPPGLNTQAPEFVPSWKKKEATSYATAVSSTSNEDTEESQNSKIALCPYFEKSGECKTTDNCPFIHGDLCELCNSWSLHPFNLENRAKHVKECTINHEQAMEHAFLEQRSMEKSCGICMENIVEKNLRFGVLNGCQHCFCLECIRQWRSRHEEADLDSKVVRSCPECRQHSDYVIPSLFWVEEGPEKTTLIEMYKENMKAKVCKYYNGTETRGNCPFGNKCFYKHQLPDGSIDPGESPHARRRPRLAEWLPEWEEADFDFDDDDEDDFPNFNLSELVYLRFMD